MFVALAGKNPVGPFALSRASEVFGMRMLMHAGKEPYIQLKTDARDKLDDTIELLQIIYDNRKPPESTGNKGGITENPHS